MLNGPMSSLVYTDIQPAEVSAPGGEWMREASAVIVCEETGCATDIYCCSYTNRHLVVITQTKKFGTMVCKVVFRIAKPILTKAFGGSTDFREGLEGCRWEHIL